MRAALKAILAGQRPLETYTKIATYMGILMPNTLVTPIRYFVADETKEVRQRLFYRDALAGGLGIVCFYLARGATRPVLAKVLADRPKPVVDMVATFFGWTANVALQAVGAIKMSEWLSRRQQGKTPVAPAPPKPVNTVSFSPPGRPGALGPVWQNKTQTAYMPATSVTRLN